MDFSRPRLKQLAQWIRDDLDPVIAQEGPDRIRADDVLALHEIFQALRKSTNISALDLRATGIHRAVMEVAGIATRWPGRLADDCDKIISVWTSKFGRLEDLHPFMYGRGGRLEGIAAAGEFSRAVSAPVQSPGIPYKEGNVEYNEASWLLTDSLLGSTRSVEAQLSEQDSLEKGEEARPHWLCTWIVSRLSQFQSQAKP
jgi:hypothetical protein